MINHLHDDFNYISGSTIGLNLVSIGLGNTIVVCACSDNGHSVSSVTDTNSNTYTRITAANGTATGDGTTINTSIWYASNVAAGNTTVNVVFSGAPGNNLASAIEYSGITLVSPIDAASNISNSTSALVGSNLTISSGNDLLVSVGLSTSTEFPTSVSAPWAAQFNSTYGTARPIAEFIAPGSPGTFHATYSGSSGTQSCSSAAAFLASSGGSHTFTLGLTEATFLGDGTVHSNPLLAAYEEVLRIDTWTNIQLQPPNQWTNSDNNNQFPPQP